MQEYMDRSKNIERQTQKGFSFPLPVLSNDFYVPNLLRGIEQGAGIF